jgi:hypothetical protein
MQEEGIVLIMLSDAAERLGSIPGARPLPAKSAQRRRGHLLPGSCGYMRPLPPGPGMVQTEQSSHVGSPVYSLLPLQCSLQWQEWIFQPC